MVCDSCMYITCLFNTTRVGMRSHIKMFPKLHLEYAKPVDSIQRISHLCLEARKNT